MELLEDADGMVRDAAKATVIELFRYVIRLGVSGIQVSNNAIGTHQIRRSLT